MRRAALTCLALGVALLESVAAAARLPSPQDAFASIEQCVARLDAQIDVGYERIAARCPELTPKLEASGFSAWLPSDWKRPGNDLSAGGLQELHRLAARELAASSAARVPHVERLAAVLATLPNRDRAHWRTRLAGQLHDLLGREEDARGGSELGEVIRQLGFSWGLIELLARAALAAIVLLAALIVLKELRLAGLLRVPRRAPGMPAPEPRAAIRPSWSDLERAPLEQRPGLLLEMIAYRSGLPGAQALTACELTRAAPVCDEDDRRCLSDVAVVAEQLRFSAHRLPPEHIAAAIASGRRLLEHLDAARAPA
jgi:hypothetical protein